MPFNIVQTTAEDIIGVVDAVLAKPENCDKAFISEFADISLVQAENALQMAMEMKLIDSPAPGFYCSMSHLGKLIVSSRNGDNKAAILRLVLEQYEPYITFKARFTYSGSLDTAAKQVKSLYSMSSG